MSLIKETWRQLVRRRLWPIAVLLLGALVAVPVVLAKSPATPPPAPVPTQAGETAAPAGDGLAEPIVAMADSSSAGHRHVLGTRKDPFQPAPQPTPKPTATPSTSSVSVSATPSPTSTPPVGTGGSTVPPSTPVTGGSTPVTPAPPAPPAAPKVKLAAGTLTVRWGDPGDGSTDTTLPTMHVKPLDALPDANAPVAIYLGPGKARNTAVFLLDSSVKPEGDAPCRPSATDCQKVVLHTGDTEFFTVDGGTSGSSTQYELDLVAVAGGKGKGKAKASRAHGARASRAHAAHARVTVARVVRLLHP